MIKYQVFFTDKKNKFVLASFVYAKNLEEAFDNALILVEDTPQYIIHTIEPYGSIDLKISAN